MAVTGTGRPGSPGDVLVLRALGLGDAAAGVAALRGVCRAWPDRRVVLAAPAAIGDWLRGAGVVDDVLPTAGLAAPLRFQRTGHVAVNLHGSGPQSHRLLLETSPQRLVAFACPDAGHHAGPAWDPDEHEVDRWCRLLTAAGGPCTREDLRLTPPGGTRTAEVVLHPGAASPARRWPAARWAWLARRLAAAGHPLVVTGSAAEAALCEEVAGPARSVGASVRTAAGALDVAGLAALVARARLVVCGDTGVAHLATAYGTASVVLFGPTPPAEWGPALDPELHTVLWRGTGRGDPHGQDLDPALASISPSDVLRAVEDQLARMTPSSAVRPQRPRRRTSLPDTAVGRPTA